MSYVEETPLTSEYRLDDRPTTISYTLEETIIPDIELNLFQILFLKFRINLFNVLPVSNNQSC